MARTVAYRNPRAELIEQQLAQRRGRLAMEGAAATASSNGAQAFSDNHLEGSNNSISAPVFINNNHIQGTTAPYSTFKNTFIINNNVVKDSDVPRPAPSMPLIGGTSLSHGQFPGFLHPSSTDPLTREERKYADFYVPQHFGTICDSPTTAYNRRRRLNEILLEKQMAATAPATLAASAWAPAPAIAPNQATSSTELEKGDSKPGFVPEPDDFGGTAAGYIPPSTNTGSPVASTELENGGVNPHFVPDFSDFVPNLYDSGNYVGTTTADPREMTMDFGEFLQNAYDGEDAATYGEDTATYDPALFSQS